MRPSCRTATRSAYAAHQRGPLGQDAGQRDPGPFAAGQRGERAGREARHLGGGHGASPSPSASTSVPATGGPQQILGGKLAWGIKESFRTYIRNGGGSVTPADGAVANGDSFAFGSGKGTLDTKERKLNATFAGNLRFQYAGHGIDMTFGNVRVNAEGDLTVSVDKDAVLPTNPAGTGGTGSTGGGTVGGGLAATGSEIPAGALLGSSAAIVAAGAGAVFFARRRRTAQN